EAFELTEAIEERDPLHFREELGDVFFNLFFFAELAREAGWFDLEETLSAMREKLIRRHPHIFAKKEGAEALSAEDVLRQWESIKEGERKDQKKAEKSLLD